MKPLLLADWAYINRLFRGAMWIVALALACVVVAFATPHPAAHAGSRPVAPALGPGHGGGGSPVPARK
jgi:hypothetical protein